jgi:hypothetical protein
MAKLNSGYCYELTGVPWERWESCSADNWDIEICDSLKGDVLGTRNIDGAICVVVKCDDGIVRAQTRQSVWFFE